MAALTDSQGERLYTIQVRSKKLNRLWFSASHYFLSEQSSLACASFPSLHTEADFPSASPSCSSTLQVIWRFSKRCFLSRIFPQAICVIPDQGVLCSWAEKSPEVPELRGLKSKEGGWPSERSRGEGDCWLWGNGRIRSWRRQPWLQDGGRPRRMEETKGVVKSTKLVRPLLHPWHPCQQVSAIIPR